jgi:hypothetical protein
MESLITIVSGRGRLVILAVVRTGSPAVSATGTIRSLLGCARYQVHTRVPNISRIVARKIPKAFTAYADERGSRLGAKAYQIVRKKPLRSFKLF